MTAGTPSRYKFGRYEIHVSRRLLFDDEGKMVALTSKVFDLLLFLVRNSGRTVSKDEIMTAVWPDTVVEESNLTQNISILRRALGDARGENAFIATVSGQGYKFVANVETGPDHVDEPAAPADGVVVAGARLKRYALPATAALLTIAAIALAVYMYERDQTASPGERAKVLAILPFKPLVETDSDKALEIGMADTLIVRLSNATGLILRPLSSVRKFADPDQDSQSAGRELGADAVLDGSIQRQGEKIRVNVRLTDVATGESLWAGTFDEQYRDIFAVQDTISIKVVDALRLRLGGATRSATRGTTNVEAYRLYMQARLFQFRSTPTEIRQAIVFYQDAIDIDPGYALAYAGMADAYRSLPITSDVDPRTAFPQSKAAALKALELDDRLSQAHLALGYVASWYEWDWAAAEAEMRRAVELDPANADARRGFSILMTLLGRHDEAIEEMKMSRELDPLSLPTNALEAQTLFYAGREAEAIERLNKTFQIDPDFWIARLMLARILIKEGRLDEALVELDRARTASAGNSEAISLAGYAKAKNGDRAGALEALATLRGYKKDSYSPAYNVAIVQNALGETDAALTELEDAVERRDVRLILLNIDHKWENLRGHPRFVSILRRMGLSD